MTKGRLSGFTMINFHLWTGSSRRWTWREDEHFLFHSPRSRGMYKFQLAGKWSESEKMSCYATLENLYGPKMDMILTISIKIAVETCLASYFADELYQLCMAYVFHCHEMHLHCFFTEQILKCLVNFWKFYLRHCGQPNQDIFLCFNSCSKWENHRKKSRLWIFSNFLALHFAAVNFFSKQWYIAYYDII